MPPGPRLPALVQGARMMRDHLSFVADRRRRYGDIFTLRLVPYGAFVVVAGHDEIRQLFNGDPEVLRAGEASGNGVYEPIWDRNGLLETFRPERFLEGQPAPYASVPFGGAVRRCIAAAFANLEMRTVLRTILGRATLRPAEDPRPGDASAGGPRTRAAGAQQHHVGPRAQRSRDPRAPRSRDRARRAG